MQDVAAALAMLKREARRYRIDPKPIIKTLPGKGQWLRTVNTRNETRRWRSDPPLEPACNDECRVAWSM